MYTSMDKDNSLSSSPPFPFPSQTVTSSPPPPFFASTANENAMSGSEASQSPFKKLPLLAENISNADRLSQLQLQVEFLASKLHDTLAFVHSQKNQTSSNAPKSPETLDKFIEQAPNDFLISTETIFKLLETLPGRPTTLEEALPTLNSYADELKGKQKELESAIRHGERLLAVVKQTRLEILSQEAERLRSP